MRPHSCCPYYACLIDSARVSDGIKLRIGHDHPRESHLHTKMPHSSSHLALYQCALRKPHLNTMYPSPTRAVQRACQCLQRTKRGDGLTREVAANSRPRKAASQACCVPGCAVHASVSPHCQFRHGTSATMTAGPCSLSKQLGRS